MPRPKRHGPIAYISQDVDEVLQYLVDRFHSILPFQRERWTHQAPVRSDDGREWSVKCGSQRYRLFNESRVCVECGRVGRVLGVTPSYVNRRGPVRYHLNLYAVEDNGDLILMTKDHIVPKSKGGANKLSNYQTMCVGCNVKKGNTCCVGRA